MSFNRTKKCTFIIQNNCISENYISASVHEIDQRRIICDNAEECTLRVLSLSKTTDLKLENCYSCTIELPINQDIDLKSTDFDTDLPTSSCSSSTHMYLNTIDFDKCKSCEIKIENQYPTAETIYSHKQLKNEHSSNNASWLMNRIKFCECESCELSIDVRNTPVATLGNEELIACKVLKSNNKIIQINTVSFEHSKTCEMNVYSNIPNNRFVDFDKVRNITRTVKSSEDCIIRNLWFSNTSLCELKLKNIETRKEQDHTLYDPLLVVDCIEIYEVFCTEKGEEKQLSLSVEKCISDLRNKMQADMFSMFSKRQNKHDGILKAIKPLEHLKEIAIGSVSKDVPLGQIFQSMACLEKLTLDSSIQSERICSIKPQMLQRKCIQAYMIQSTIALPYLKSLELSGLSVYAYTILANVLPTLQLVNLAIRDTDIDIPESVVKSISKHVNLNHLTMEGREIQNIQCLANLLLYMTKLDTLKLSSRDTDIPGSVVEYIGTHNKMEHLTLKGRQIQNVELLALSRMTQLETLKLSSRDTDIPGSVVKSIRNHVNLEHLTLKGKQIQNVECLANFLLDMKQLEKLKLSSRDTDIPRSVVESIGKLTNIKHLTLEGKQIQNVELLDLSRMTQLETLKLSSRDTDIQGSVVESIRNLNKMKHLTFQGSILSGECLAKFLFDMTQLETLRLSSRDTYIPRSVLKSIRRLDNLKHLTLEGRRIQNLLVSIVLKLKQLETLKLSSRDTDIPGSVINCIKNDTCLKILKYEGRSLECARVSN